MSTYDPRTEISHDIETGQIYRDSRTNDKILLVYVDRNTYLLRDTDGNHRLGKRSELDENIGSGRYKLDPDAEPFGDTGHVRRVLRRADEYEEQGGRKGKHYAEAMREAVSILSDTGSPDAHETVEFEEIAGVGQATATALRNNGYTTRADIRRADDSTLLKVRGVGEGNLENIRNVVG